jgi:hypothetical protein
MKAVLCVLALATLTVFAEVSPTVNLAGGQLRGSALGSGAVFKGTRSQRLQLAICAGASQCR